MIFLYIFLAIVFLIAFLLFSKVKIRFIFDKDKKITVSYLFISLDGEKLIEKIREPKKSKPEKKTEASAEKKKRKKGSISDFIGFVSHITSVLKEAAKNLIKCLYVNVKKLEIRISTGDAAKTALVYGGAVGCANALFEVADRFSHLKKNDKNIILAPDFASEKTSLALDIVLAIRLYSLIKVGFGTYLDFINIK